jgi:hypothetical protein
MPTEFNPLVSFYSDAFENLPTDIPAADFIASIKSGNYAGKISGNGFKTLLLAAFPMKMQKRPLIRTRKNLLQSRWRESSQCAAISSCRSSPD